MVCRSNNIIGRTIHNRGGILISDELINVLVCPKCQGKVKQAEDALVCEFCSLSYPINEDIPVMLIDAAHKIDSQQAQRL
jgi:uncharacterized protein YbaR (Trm112 family)